MVSAALEPFTLIVSGLVADTTYARDLRSQEMQSVRDVMPVTVPRLPRLLLLTVLASLTR